MKRGQGTYDVFVRDWWRRPEPHEGTWPDNRMPYPGAPRRYIARGVSCEEAREICAKYAAEYPVDWRSRKAEFESAS